MLKNKSDLKERDIEFSPRNIDIHFLDNGDSIILELPSADELMILKEKYTPKFSISSLPHKDIFNSRQQYKDELNRLQNKYEKYKESSSYLVNMSNLASLIDDDTNVKKYLDEASKVDTASYIKHEIGNYFIKKKDFDTARTYFLSIDNQNDVYTKLRLAYFSTLNEDLEQAQVYVEEARDIEPDNYDVNLFYGAILLCRKELEQAVRAFKVALNENPNSSVAYVNLAAAYWGLGYKGKTYSFLKRSVAIDPLNLNAIAFYSDVTFLLAKEEKKLEKIESSVPVLENFLHYEQAHTIVWEQLARAYYFTGRQRKSRTNLLKALETIKHLESMDSSYSTWNNMGLIVWELGDFDAAKRYLNFSLKKALDESLNVALPLHNLCGLLISRAEYANALNLLEKTIGIVLTSPDPSELLDKLRLQHVVMLEGIGKRQDAILLTNEYLASELSNTEVRLDLLNRVIYYYTTYSPDLKVIIECESAVKEILELDTGYLENKKTRVLNNLAFAFLNFDMIQKAEVYLRQVNTHIHLEAFVTATFGLYSIKKGDFDKGTVLYKEAISLLIGKKSKNRFRQRLNYELGKAYLLRDEPTKALRLFKKALSEKNGFSYVSHEINTLISDRKLISKR